MEPSSSVSQLLLLFICTLILFSSFDQPVNSVHISQDLYYNQSRNTSVSPPPPPSSAPIRQPPLLPAHPPSPVPALFVNGNSSVYCGYNNFLGTSFDQPINSVRISQDLYVNQSRNTSVSPPPPSSSPIPQPPLLPAHPPSPVPALFVIGNSFADCGYNNFLGTLACADHLPYGPDSDTHQPTDRFSNVRVPVDYLESESVMHLGEQSVPSYLGPSGAIEDMIYGLDYGYAGPGIICSSGAKLGQHKSFSWQIQQQVMNTFQQFILRMGEYISAKGIVGYNSYSWRILAEFYKNSIQHDHLQVSDDIPPIYCLLIIYTLFLTVFLAWYWVRDYDPTYVLPLDDSGSDSEVDSQPSTDEEYSDIDPNNVLEHRTRLQARLAALVV